ncbi:MAG: tetratricopeptide repeat protein [Labilithrix sp.]|nr:tetratricopeptide repeat protein [Labilithrix sp.]
MDRGELEGLDRESLVLRAQDAGIRRARILTRPELIDELLRLDPTADAAQLKKTRGFFGRARDLVARVVERGLHLPDAAERIRGALGTLPPSVPRAEPQAMPTVTLAEIYAAQGHSKRAIDTLRRVLEREPDHAAARALLARLEDTAYVAPPPPLPPEPEIEPEIEPDVDSGDEMTTVYEPPPPEIIIPTYPTERDGVRAAEPRREEELEEEEATEENVDPTYAPTRVLPRKSGRTYTVSRPVDADADTEILEVAEADECVAIPLSGRRMYVRWRVSRKTLDRMLRDRTSRTGRFTLRAHVITPSWDGPVTETRDVVVEPSNVELTLRDLPQPSVVRAAIGWLDAGTFVPVAHSPALDVTDRGVSIWTFKGSRPIALDDPRAAPIARAFEASRRLSQSRA